MLISYLYGRRYERAGYGSYRFHRLAPREGGLLETIESAAATGAGIRKAGLRQRDDRSECDESGFGDLLPGA